MKLLKNFYFFFLVRIRQVDVTGKDKSWTQDFIRAGKGSHGIMGGHTDRMVVPTIPNQSFEFWIFGVIPVFYQELLHFLPHIPERDTRPVIVQAGFPDPVGHFIYFFLL